MLEARRIRSALHEALVHNWRTRNVFLQATASEQDGAFDCARDVHIFQVWNLAQRDHVPLASAAAPNVADTLVACVAPSGEVELQSTNHCGQVRVALTSRRRLL
eukprot:3078033-Prymnesium_polylepis.2